MFGAITLPLRSFFGKGSWGRQVQISVTDTNIHDAISISP